MRIDDSYKSLLIDAGGTHTVPNASAVAFSLVPVTGKFPVEVVLDGDVRNPLVVDSPRYHTDGVPFTKLEVRSAPPGTTFRLRLLTDRDAGDYSRSLHSAAGNLVMEPAGAVLLFDIDTNTTGGIAAFRALAASVLAEDPGGTQDQLFQIMPAAPVAFSRVVVPPTPPDAYYESIAPPPPTWNVSAAREVVFGLEMWGNPVDDTGVREFLPGFGLLKPRLHMVEADGGATVETPLTMGTDGDFAPDVAETLPATGRHGIVSTGSLSSTVTDWTRRIARRTRFARFELLLKGGTLSLSDFQYQRRFMRLFAYSVV